jgi:chemotaxis protein MotB
LPIRTGRFKSNWELSSARSIAVMEILAQRFGIPKERMSVAGYADNFPVGSNDSPDGRSRNRRVDVVFLGEEARIANPGNGVRR